MEEVYRELGVNILKFDVTLNAVGHIASTTMTST
jgi:hypothetical protein